MVRQLASVLLMFVLLIACGVPATGANGSGSPAPAQTQSTADAIVATYSKSGGLAGADETMTVYADGKVSLKRSGKTQATKVDAGQIKTLQQALRGWQALKPSYGRQMPDAFKYVIEAGGKTVETYDGAQNPAALEAVMQQLEAFYQIASRTS